MTQLSSYLSYEPYNGTFTSLFSESIEKTRSTKCSTQHPAEFLHSNNHSYYFIYFFLIIACLHPKNISSTRAGYSILFSIEFPAPGIVLGLHKVLNKYVDWLRDSQMEGLMDGWSDEWKNVFSWSNKH